MALKLHIRVTMHIHDGPEEMRTHPHLGRSDGTAQAPWTPDIGSWVGGAFRLERLVGMGGLGMVFAARDVALDRPVALKVLRPELAPRSELRAALVREARLVAGFRHERIVTVHACGSHRGNPYVVMELIDGSNALQCLQVAEGRLPISEALRIVCGVCEGLGALHRMGVVHGDVKPSNVLLGVEDCVKLTDIGGSLVLGDALRGTPCYSAPEQTLDGGLPSVAADIYALGVAAYQLFTGELPFGARASSLPGQVKRDLLVPASELRGDLPRALDGVLAQALAELPSERPRSANALAEQIRAALTPSSLRLASRVAPAIGHPPEDPDEERPLEVRRVLFAAADATQRQAISMALAKRFRGCAIEAVESGQDALGAARHQLPDVAVLASVPGDSTPNTTRALRSLRGGAAMAIIVVLERGWLGERRELEGAGADAFLDSPLNVDDLITALADRARRVAPIM